MFRQYDDGNAPEKSKPFLEATKKSFGMIPNLERTMAALPELLSVYSFAWDEFASVGLSPIEQQVVYQTANFENECSYCVPWHTLLSRKAGMQEAHIEQLRNGTTISDAKLNALSGFTRKMIHNRGKVSRFDLEELYEVGYNETDALAVILGIAIKTMSNFTNSIAGTPLDTQVASLKWNKPFVKNG